MKITDVQIETLELPYKKPLITATNQFYSSNGFLVSVESEEGHTGYGYIDVFPRTGETMGSHDTPSRRSCGRCWWGNPSRTWPG